MSLWWLCPHRLSEKLFIEITGTLLTMPVLIVNVSFGFQGTAPFAETPPILLRDSGISQALFGVRLGTVALEARLPAPPSDKTVLDLARIRLVQRRVCGSLNGLDLAGY